MLKVKPRLYQEKILATAIKGNTLVVLPTGLGKTLIAVMLGIIRSKVGKILFLAPTKPLIEQHQKYLKEVAGIDAALYYGAIPKEKRKDVWKNNKWIIATPQTIQNDLLDWLNLEDVSLIIFDEAHRATGNYAYTYIAKRYVEEAKDPLILAMTASPGNDEEKIKEILDNLFIKYVEVRTEKDADVKPYIGEKMVEWIEVELSKKHKELITKIKKVLSFYLKSLKTLGYLETADVNKVRKTDLLELQKNIKDDFDAISITAAALKAMYALELAETQSMHAYAKFLEKLKKDRSKAAKELINLLPEPLPIEHPKLEKLIELIENEKSIVFANYSSQVELIVEYLKSKGIKAEKFMGQKQGMSQKKQREIIEKFRNDEFDVLVATSVAEEGIDIPSVKKVIFYEPVPSVIRHIQRRGRLRRGGKVYILITKNTREEAYFYAAKAREREMVRILRYLKPKIKAQATLSSFVEEDYPIVIIDDREINLAKILGKNARIHHLEVGDIIISDKVAIERKTARDFVDSIIDQRLFTQISELKKAYEKPILIIEGKDLYRQRNIHPNAIRGALASIAIDWEIPIIFTNDIYDTAETIKLIAKREFEAGRKPVIKVAKKAKDNDEMKERIVATLPNVSATLAKRMLEKFRTVKNVFNASEDELKQIEGIGDKKAREIVKIINEEYKG